MRIIFFCIALIATINLGYSQTEQSIKQITDNLASAVKQLNTSNGLAGQITPAKDPAEGDASFKQMNAIAKEADKQMKATAEQGGSLKEIIKKNNCDEADAALTEAVDLNNQAQKQMLELYKKLDEERRTPEWTKDVELAKKMIEITNGINELLNMSIKKYKDIIDELNECKE